MKSEKTWLNEMIERIDGMISVLENANESSHHIYEISKTDLGNMIIQLQEIKEVFLNGME